MKNELVFKNHNRGFEVAKALLDEGNVVMLSYEEQFLIVNWEYGEDGYADRNCVIFMQKEEYEELEDRLCDAIFTDLRNDIKRGRIKDLSDI